MAVSGSRNFIANRNDLIQASLRKLGAVAQGQTPSAEAYTEASFALNSMVLGWQLDNIFLWTQSDDLQLLTADTASYTLDSDIVSVENVFFRRDNDDTLLTPITREEYKDIPDKKTSGKPLKYYLDTLLAAPVLYLWPVPEYSTGCIVGSDTNNYLCSVSHTSSSDDFPITGSDYADYWESTSETGSVWVTATSYYSDVIRYTKVLRLQDFDTSSDNPDFPVRYYQALTWGLADQLSNEYPAVDNARRAEIHRRFLEEYARIKTDNFDGTPLIISPRFR